MEKEVYIKNEIESHSSALTNQRIFNIEEVVWQQGIECLSNKFNPIRALNFASPIIQWFLNTHSMYDEKINEEIKKEIEKNVERGLELMFKFRKEYVPTEDEVQELNLISLKLQYLMHRGGQNLRYFFRVGSQEARGISEALKIFDQDKWKKKND